MPVPKRRLVPKKPFGFLEKPKTTKQKILPSGLDIIARRAKEIRKTKKK